MTPPRPPADHQMVDMRIPLTWLLSAAVAILTTLGATLWNIAGQSNKLDQLIVANAKLEKRLDDRDVRLDMLREKISTYDRAIDALQMRVNNLERPLLERAAPVTRR